MPAHVSVEARRLSSGAINVKYRAGRYHGAVMFDAQCQYIDATKQTFHSTRDRGFVNHPDDLPAGVLSAARLAAKATAL